MIEVRSSLKLFLPLKFSMGNYSPNLLAKLKFERLYLSEKKETLIKNSKVPSKSPLEDI